MDYQVYIYFLCFFSIFFMGIKCSGENAAVINVTWGGGRDSCSCTPGGMGANYACTEGDGDWASGVKYFPDNQNDTSFVLTQANVSIYGSFDCMQDQTIVVMLNEQVVGSVRIPYNSNRECYKCKNCLASTSPITLQSPKFPSGFPDYNEGFPNEIAITLKNQTSPGFCVSHISLSLTYAQLPDSSDSNSGASWDLDAPPWFWTLVAAVGVIVLVLVTTLFVLWRRSRAVNISGNSKSWGNYRALSSTEYIDPSQLEDISIDMNEFTMDKEIGHGSFGLVYKAIWRGTEVAVKKLPRDSISEEQVLLEFMKEAFIMRQLRHPNVLQVLGVCLDPPCIVMEYMPKGSLYQLIHSHTDVALDWHVIKKLAIEICRGMAYLHGSSPPLIHRDLKPHNLLVDEMWRVKVCDFGLSRFWEAKRDMTACGTPAYAAPEVLRNSAYSVSADVYSFAIVLWELITRQPLYPGMPPFQIIFAVGTQGTRPTLPPTCSPALAALIQDCWAEDPASRPSFVSLGERITEMQEDSS